ncbi:hypothetical protein SAMN05421743_102230 [Thalassobacillus cyri]|uniref:DUF4352 domain-containing protein n=1 Tax=Thalassobacillus cyri TaxID=571932 RepID=A0A1H3XRP1_9BACI|nr:hypothetical protein [Thalassobacillus cyri]SEA02003.1 hypothetical protein SAMN05421743_102230 [Thalassobacillus cyri]
MKHLIMLVFSLILLAGCSTYGNNTESHAETKDSTAPFEIPEKKKYSNNPQASDDRELKQAGDHIEDENGQLALETIKEGHTVEEIGPVQLVIEDIKVLNYSPSPDLIDYFHAFSDNEANFNYIKFTVAVKNTSDQPINFAPVDLLETNAGEKKDFDDDFYLEKLYGKYESGEVKFGNMGFVLNDTKVDELKSITITTSDVMDESQGTIAEAKEFEIGLE